jgi:hypothetical protein
MAKVVFHVKERTKLSIWMFENRITAKHLGEMIAERLGIEPVSVNTVRNWRDHGRYPRNKKILRALSDVSGIPIDELLGV